MKVPIPKWLYDFIAYATLTIIFLVALIWAIGANGVDQLIAVIVTIACLYGYYVLIFYKKKN